MPLVPIQYRPCSLVWTRSRFTSCCPHLLTL